MSWQAQSSHITSHISSEHTGPRLAVEQFEVSNSLSEQTGFTERLTAEPLLQTCCLPQLCLQDMYMRNTTLKLIFCTSHRSPLLRMTQPYQLAMLQPWTQPYRGRILPADPRTTKEHPHIRKQMRPHRLTRQSDRPWMTWSPRRDRQERWRLVVSRTTKV